MKIELGIELRGDLTVEEEKFLRSQIDERMEKTKSLQKYVKITRISVFIESHVLSLSLSIYLLLTEHQKKD
jgi:5-bromo-4-chloroindolyl phosphate hydrolysis protein